MASTARVQWYCCTVEIVDDSTPAREGDVVVNYHQYRADLQPPPVPQAMLVESEVDLAQSIETDPFKLETVASEATQKQVKTQNTSALTRARSARKKSKLQQSEE